MTLLYAHLIPLVEQFLKYLESSPSVPVPTSNSSLAQENLNWRFLLSQLQSLTHRKLRENMKVMPSYDQRANNDYQMDRLKNRIAEKSKREAKQEADRQMVSPVDKARRKPNPMPRPKPSVSNSLNSGKSSSTPAKQPEAKRNKAEATEASKAKAKQSSPRGKVSEPRAKKRAPRTTTSGSTGSVRTETSSLATAKEKVEDIMPKPVNKKKKKNKPGKKPPKKNGGKSKESKGGSGGGKFYRTDPAPTTQIPTTHPGPSLTFRGSGDTLEISIRFRIGQIVSTAGSLIVFSITGGTTNSIVLTPQNSFYFPTYVTNFCQQFRFFKLSNVTLETLPRVATTVSTTYMIAAVDDPEWPEAVGGASGTAFAPTETVLSSLKNACTVVSYNPCQIRIPINRQVGVDGWAYTYATTANGSPVNWTGTAPTDLRTQVPAVVMLVGTGAAASTTYADVFFRGTISLRELTLVQSVPTMQQRLIAALRELGPDRSMRIVEEFFHANSGDEEKAYFVKSEDPRSRSRSPVSTSSRDLQSNSSGPGWRLISSKTEKKEKV